MSMADTCLLHSALVDFDGIQEKYVLPDNQVAHLEKRSPHSYTDNKNLVKLNPNVSNRTWHAESHLPPKLITMGILPVSHVH